MLAKWSLRLTIFTRHAHLLNAALDGLWLFGFRRMSQLLFKILSVQIVNFGTIYC